MDIQNWFIVRIPSSNCRFRMRNTSDDASLFGLSLEGTVEGLHRFFAGNRPVVRWPVRQPVCGKGRRFCRTCGELGGGQQFQFTSCAARLMTNEVPKLQSDGDADLCGEGSLRGLDTSTSLLRMLGERDATAWSNFGRRYAIFLLRWCEKAGVPRTDAEDLVQETFIRILEQVQKFHRRGVGSFRSWIKAIAWHCWCDVIRRSKRRDCILQMEPFRQSWLTAESVEEGLESLIRQEMIEIASLKARQRVSEQAWEAYRLITFDGASGVEVATRLGMSLGAVYTSKCRVQQAITSELRKMGSESE